MEIIVVFKNLRPKDFTALLKPDTEVKYVKFLHMFSSLSPTYSKRISYVVDQTLGFKVNFS